MSSSTIPHIEVKKWRIIVFSIVAGLLALLLLYGGVPDLLLLDGQSGFPSIIHRWHEAQSGALLVVLLAGSFLVLLWQPQRKPLVAQFLVLGVAIACLCFAALNGSGFSLVAPAAGSIFIAILVAAYPSFRILRNFSREGQHSLPLLVLSLLAAVFLAPIALRELQWQLIGVSEHDVHALNYHWLTSVILSVLLVLAGILSSTKRPGWQVLSSLTGIAYLYLGSMALLLPGYAGSWGTIGGVLGLLGGIGYIAATALEVQQRRREIRSRPAEMATSSS